MMGLMSKQGRRDQANTHTESERRQMKPCWGLERRKLDRERREEQNRKRRKKMKMEETGRGG